MAARVELNKQTDKLSQQKARRERERVAHERTFGTEMAQ